nr:MAG TPA: hypothetical protein [Caudoviricetes sp.]
MSKAVLISIRPKWCEKICNGEKTVEVRKTRPKLNTPFRVYIYCTLPKYPHEDFIATDYPKPQFYGGGKVIGEFICDRIYELETRSPGGSYYVKGEGQPTTNDVARQSCLGLGDMYAYLESKTGYGLHIAGLEVYDTPKELSEFRKACAHDWYCDSCAMYRENNGTCGDESLRLKRPPQSWCYVEEM